MPLLKAPRLKIASHRFKGVDEASSDSSFHAVFLLSKNAPNCSVSCDHVPRRSWPLFRAKSYAGQLNCWIQQSQYSIALGAVGSMSSSIHPQARTTPKTRQEMKDAGLSSREAAKVFNITRATAQKWRGRGDVQDRSHRAHTLRTTLSQAQEAIVLALRQSLYLPLDDLLFITKQYINPAVSRAGIARLLKREGMSRLTDLIATAEGEKITPKKTFKDYEPSFIHIDIK